MTWRIINGDCLEVMPTIEGASIDAVITDPPYPCIKRSYGYWTEQEWWALMVDGLIPEIRRVLKPSGSAVFILQPNSSKVGSMRGWLWEFMAWVCREWNMVQDIWWWNYTALPTGVSTPRERGLTRSSVKSCVWCGESTCYRNQDNILISESDINAYRRTKKRFERNDGPSKQGAGTSARTTALERGGVTPFNLLLIPRGGGESMKCDGHSAGTPLKLADWWTRYICPEGGTILDPFNGAGTMGVAAVQRGCNYIGIEKDAEYCDISERRIREAAEKPLQADFLPAIDENQPERYG